MIKRDGKQKKHEGKILRFFGLIMAGTGVVMTAVTITLVIVLQTWIVALILERTIYSVAGRLAGGIECYESLPWLLDYWETHPEELRSYETLSDHEKSELITEWHEHYDQIPSRITVEQAEGFDEGEQRVFAEYCYEMIAGDFSTSEHSYFEISSFCFRQKGDEGFLFFYNDGHGENEDGFAVGDCIPLSTDVRKGIAAEKDKADGLTFIDVYFNDTKDRFGVLRPIVREGQVLCVVMCNFRTADVYRAIKRSIILLLVPIVVMTLLVGVVLMLVLYHKVVKPVGIVQETVRKYSQTKDSADMDSGLGSLLNKNDEYGRLSADITKMARSIDLYVDEIRIAAAEKQRMGAELDMARTIQKSQLPGSFPAFPHRKDFDLYALMEPAKEVGGDFYDFFLIDDDHIALVVGDVSDKGIPAALVMMVCKNLIRSTLMQKIAPAAAMEHVNRQICESNEADMFVTVWLAVIELSTGRGTEINAGHEKPVLCRAGGKYELIKNRHDMAIGSFAEQDFTEHSFSMGRGDKLFVFTDGVPEAVNGDNEQFGLDRMLDSLNNDSALVPEGQILNMRASIADFVASAEQFDDITMLCFTLS